MIRQVLRSDGKILNNLNILTIWIENTVTIYSVGKWVILAIISEPSNLKIFIHLQFLHHFKKTRILFITRLFMFHV